MLSVKAHWRVTLTNTTLPNNITTVPITGGGAVGTTSYTFSPAGNGATWVNSTVNPVLTVSDSKMTLDQTATMEVKGKMVLNGIDLEERLKTIEEVLQIPERDVILEQKHPKLKKMYDEYIRTLKKYRTWESLKGTENEN